MRFFDLFHFNRGGRIQYHWFSLPRDRWVDIDMTVGRDPDNSEASWSGDGGKGLYWYRKSVGEKFRKAVGVYGSTTRTTASASFRAPYEVMSVYLGQEGRRG